MTSAVGTASIASLYSVCIRSFDQLSDLLQRPNCEFSSQIPPLTLQDELGRFRIWAGNVGAHRNGRISLDHRLREASQIHKKVTELLRDLDGALQESIAIVSHERKPFDELSWSSDSSVSSLEDGSTTESEDEINSTTELQERLLQITHVITCLYKFSIVIRNPAPRDRLEKCASIDTSHYEFFDKQHTSHKFPRAETYLIDRLGIANSRRRQLFKYHEKHHNKLARYIDLPQPGGTRVDLQLNQYGAAKGGKELPESMGEDQDLQNRLSNTMKGPGTIATTINTQTTVSTYVQGPSDAIEVCSDAGQSQTSYATSVSGDTGNKVRVPPPPKLALEGNPFECPYCFCILIMRSPQAWVKHVFRDLRPYVCTFRDCPKPDRLFDSRHDWYNHEFELHRREWFCNACRQPFPSKVGFEDHLRQNHSDLFTKSQLPAVVDRCEIIIDSGRACPLCEEIYLPRQLQGHLARHMQQLALFTIPKVAEETAGDGESGGAQASNDDEKEIGEGSIDSINLDLAFNSSQEMIDDVSGTMNEIPDTQNETWTHLTSTKDAVYREFRFGSGEPDPEQVTQVIEEIKKVFDPKIPDSVVSIANLVLAYLNQGRLDRNSWQAAAGEGHEKLMKILFEVGTNVKTRQEIYKNVLSEAARNGHKEVVQLLLENGADVNAQGGAYGNALQAAAERGDKEVVRLLLENGADINAQGGEYGNALQAAALHGHKEVVQLFLEQGADVNAQGGEHRNALHAAASWGHARIVQLLLEAGADVNTLKEHASQAGSYSQQVQLLIDKYLPHIDKDVPTTEI